MTTADWLLVAIALPLLGAVITGALLSRLGRDAARVGALVFSLLTLAVTGYLVSQFPADGVVGDDFAATRAVWVAPDSGLPVQVDFHIGLDGLSLWLVGLTSLLMVTSVLVSWEAIEDRPGLFYGMLLLLECGCLGVFCAKDLLLFYVFFEFTLIPLFFLIGIWGSEQRQYAARKFFLYTLAGSLLTFLGLLALVLWNYTGAGLMTFSIPELTRGLASRPVEPLGWQLAIFLALFAGFAIKVPLFPFHTWLPLAHVQAPTAGSVFLAGVLLKIGTYGFLRFSIPMLPQATAACLPWLLWLSVVGILYGALVALAQGDMKRLIAYSSVSHLGYCMLGLFALNRLGIQGGTLQMVNHGLSTGALFALVGMLYERYHTREIRALSGVARRLPWFAFFLVLFTMSSIGLPGLNGFVGEFMVLLGMFQRAFAESPEMALHLKVAAVLAVVGVVLGAWYMLWLVQRICFGRLQEPHVDESVRDLSWREIGALAPLAVFVVWIGVQPQFFLERMQPSLNPLSEPARQALIDAPQDDGSTAASRPGQLADPDGTEVARRRTSP